MNELTVNSLAVEEELISVISNHLSSAGGKRMRPILTLLSSKMFNYSGDNSIRLATAIEFIHMATLLHDDVVDGSKMRRFVPTANVLWGSRASILVGDFLFSQSFKLIVSTNAPRALEVLSSASAIIAEGEVSQLSKLQQKSIITIDEYNSIIKAKTAELFSAACEVGAIIAKKEQYSKALNEFGLYLGMAFQISDDALDYWSTAETVGKNIGDDFDEGKVTLPLILLYDRLEDQDRSLLDQMLKAESRTKEDFAWVKGKMKKYKIAILLSGYLQDLRVKAIKSIESVEVDDVQSKKFLINLLDFSIERAY